MDNGLELTELATVIIIIPRILIPEVHEVEAAWHHVDAGGWRGTREGAIWADGASQWSCSDWLAAVCAAFRCGRIPSF